MFSCILSLRIDRFCGEITAFGVRFLAPFLLAFLLRLFGFVALLHFEPWSILEVLLSDVHTAASYTDSSASSIEQLSSAMAVEGGNACNRILPDRCISHKCLVFVLVASYFNVSQCADSLSGSPNGSPA